MLIADAMVDTVKPSLQISEGGVDHWQKLIRNLRVAALGDAQVSIPPAGEVVIAFPVIGNNVRAWHNRPFDEAAQRFRGAVWHNGESYAACVSPVLPLVELGARLALAHLNSTSDKAHIVDATAFAARSATDISLIDLDVFIERAANPVLVRSHHAGAELVQDLECCFIPGQSKLPLKLYRRYSRRLAGHPVSSPEPDVKRRMRTLHHSSCLQACVSLTFTASKHVGLIDKPDRFPRCLAMRANKSFWPTQFLQVSRAGRNIREKPLKLWKRVRERQVVTLVNVH